MIPEGGRPLVPCTGSRDGRGSLAQPGSTEEGCVWGRALLLSHVLWREDVILRPHAGSRGCDEDGESPSLALSCPSPTATVALAALRLSQCNL